ncbi:MAG TPA: ribonuclease Y, partial [Abditibacterium sp.]
FRKEATVISSLLWAFVCLIVGLTLGALSVAVVLRSRTTQAHTTLLDAQRKLADLDADLANRHKELQLEAREETQREVARLRELIEREATERRAELKEAENRLREREQGLERRLKSLEGRERGIALKETAAVGKFEEAEGLLARQNEALERVANLSASEAKEILLQRVEHEARGAMAHVAHRIEEEARENAEERARKIIAMAIQRCAVDQTSETAVSVVPIPSEDVKGRIIGREGRNIRTFEQLSGTDLIIDDTPEAVVVSCFDPVRRETARIALQNLVNDGRIHPARIEEMLGRAKLEVQVKMREAAERACTEANVRLPKPIMEVFGRLLYRTSYGQNILKHSVEMAKLASSIAAEIGADVQVAKRAAFLHDIGKALDHDHEGTHVDLGVELLKRHRESDAVICAAGEHHMDVTQMTSLESVIVQIADAISSARPGARRENVEIYIKRLENLEKIANSFAGVDKSYAIQAGREVRIVVKPEQVDDLASLRLARDVAQRIQEEMTYPGEIKITVIRETRATEIAH